MTFWDWCARIPWFAWIAIIAIIGGTVTSITKLVINHRERMAVLEHKRPGDLET